EIAGPARLVLAVEHRGQRRKRDRVAVADVLVVVVELFMPHLDAHGAKTLHENSRTEIEVVLVLPAAVDVVQAQPREGRPPLQAALCRVPEEPAREDVLAE